MQAGVGIAIGGGVAVAVESVTIILIKNNPSDVVSIFTLCVARYRIMKENLILAAGYNVIAIPLAAGVFASLDFLLYHFWETRSCRLALGVSLLMHKPFVD